MKAPRIRTAGIPMAAHAAADVALGRLGRMAQLADTYMPALVVEGMTPREIDAIAPRLVAIATWLDALAREVQRSTIARHGR
ncbi:MAG: hypothetical protein AB7P02_01530 [Alphaproteobacteria bacterium]